MQAVSLLLVLVVAGVPGTPLPRSLAAVREASSDSSYSPAYGPPLRGPAAQVWECPKAATSLDTWGVVKTSYGADNLVFQSEGSVVRGVAASKTSSASGIATPVRNGSATHVMRVRYPAGSCAPSGAKRSRGGKVGGTGFYAAPLDLAQAREVSLEYEVYFPTDFDFVKGGKLPGLYGGHPGCSGGNRAKDCFSARFMWRTKGAGELYAYVDAGAQAPDYCTAMGPKTVCNPTYGDSLGRGSFHFQPGRWTRLQQFLTLNTPGKQDGRVRVLVDGQVVIAYDKLAWRSRASVGFSGIDFETFFGGHGHDWVTPRDQFALFRNFRLSADH